ncbi:hypothetical protein D3C72_2361490 [compost metagenome]
MTAARIALPVFLMPLSVLFVSGKVGSPLWHNQGGASALRGYRFTHHASGKPLLRKPRSYFGVFSGKPSVVRWAIQLSGLYQCGTM